MRRAVLLVIASVLGGLCVGLAGCSDPDPPLAPSYRVTLEAEGGALPFRMDLVDTGAVNDDSPPDFDAYIHNGEEVIRVEDVTVSHNPLEVVVRFGHSGSVLTLRADKKLGGLSGAWAKPRPKGEIATLLARATSEDADVRFEPHPSGVVDADAFGGRWRIDFGEGHDPGVGVFDVAPDGTTLGTIMTSTGDYRFLAGRVDAGMLRLSAFDGSHAILVRANLQDDGMLLGDTSWGNWALVAWSAARDEDASLPDPSSIASVTPDVSIDEVAIRTLGGEPTTLRAAVDELGARATVVLVFGSWCPNSADATEDLVRLLGRYGDRGLGVIGLAYQNSEAARAESPRVEAYCTLHDVRWPVYLGGVTDKQQAGQTLPIISKVHAYPTLIFLDAAGTPVSVLTGYNGPASGGAHARFVAAVEAEIETLLAE